MGKCEDCKYYTAGEETYCAYDFGDYISCVDNDQFEPKEPTPIKTWQDGPFTLTNSNHYFIIMADHKYNDYVAAYSGMKHATIESARMALGYSMGDDWGKFIKELYIKEVIENE